MRVEITRDNDHTSLGIVFSYTVKIFNDDVLLAWGEAASYSSPEPKEVLAKAAESALAHLRDTVRRAERELHLLCLGGHR